MAFTRGNVGAGILQSLGGQGLSLASRGFDRVYNQSLVNRQSAEDEAQRKREEKARKEAEKKARNQMLANLGISIGTSALVGGVDALASPAIDTAVDAGTDAATDATGNAVSDAAGDVATEGVTDTASKTANTVDFSGPPVDASTLSSGGFSRTAPLPAPPSDIPTVGDYQPVGPTQSLVHRPRGDGMSRVLANDNVSYSPGAGSYTGTSNAGSRFMRGFGRGALAGGVYGLASMYPGLAPVAQATFNRMDPVYNAKLGEIQGRTGYSDARTDQVRQLTPYKVESEMAQGFQRRASGVSSLASAGESNADAGYKTAITNPTVSKINQQADTELSRGKLFDRKAEDIVETQPHRIGYIDAQANERNTAADENTSGAGLKEAQTGESIGRESRNEALAPSKLRGSEADATFKETRNAEKAAENAGELKHIQAGTPEQSRSAMKKWIAHAEANIDANPDGDSRHATITETLARWKQRGVPEEYLMDIEQGWRRKYKFAPRPAKNQRTVDGAGVELE